MTVAFHKPRDAAEALALLAGADAAPGAANADGKDTDGKYSVNASKNYVDSPRMNLCFLLRFDAVDGCKGNQQGNSQNNRQEYCSRCV